ncbi:hypothetical protein HDU82_008460, partial [Entophlyctis luteolus]
MFGRSRRSAAFDLHIESGAASAAVAASAPSFWKRGIGNSGGSGSRSNTRKVSPPPPQSVRRFLRSSPSATLGSFSTGDDVAPLLKHSATDWLGIELSAVLQPDVTVVTPTGARTPWQYDDDDDGDHDSDHSERTGSPDRRRASDVERESEPQMYPYDRTAGGTSPELGGRRIDRAIANAYQRYLNGTDWAAAEEAEITVQRSEENDSRYREQYNL